MADVFISYERNSASFAKALSAAFQSRGYSVWIDDRLPSHRPYSDVIQEELDGAKAVVVAWSEEAAGSQWVRSEANRARERGTLVQVTTDGTQLPMPFEQIQCPSLQGWDGKADAPVLDPIIASVDELTRAKGQEKPRTDRLNQGRSPPKPDPEAELLVQAAMRSLQEG